MSKTFKIIHTLLGIVLLCGALFCLFEIFEYLRIGTVADVREFSEPKDLYGNEKCYETNKYLYIVDSTVGTIHIFDKNGEFKNGLQLPTNGGSMWVGINENLYAYCIRRDLLVEIDGIKITSQENAYYNNPKNFYASLNLIEKDFSKIRGNVVYAMQDNQEMKVTLDITPNILTINICIVLFFACVLGFLFCFKGNLFFSTKRTQGDGSFSTR